MGKGENLYLLALTYKILRKKLRNCFSERVKLVFKMQKLVFKTPKLLSPAFCLQGLGWISHKKSLYVHDLGKKKFFDCTSMLCLDPFLTTILLTAEPPTETLLNSIFGMLQKGLRSRMLTSSAAALSRALCRRRFSSGGVALT